jgi:hypothetical protein
MKLDIKGLVDQIKVTPDNTGYNFCNILKGNVDDPDWLANRIRLQQQGSTILGLYFNHPLVRDKISEPGYIPGLLKQMILKYIDINNPLLPGDDETCLYVRAGDIVVFDDQCIDQLHSSKHTITIVSNISFSGDSPVNEDWKFCGYKVNDCMILFESLLEKIHEKFPKKQLKIVSNNDPDIDICYLFHNGFISHPKCSWKKIFGNF